MKLKPIGEDGAIQGWFVSFLLTFFRLTIFVGAYFHPKILDAEMKIGPAFTTFVLTSVGSWFAYKVIKPITEKTPQ